MKQTTKQAILEANVVLHQKEAYLYDEIHPELNSLEEIGRLKNLLELADTKNKQKKLALDIGAGTGFVSSHLLKLGYTTTAVDISKEMLDILNTKLGDNPNLTITTSDADGFLEKDNQKYHVITSSSVLHHLPDYEASIAEMTKHLTDDGYLLFFHEPTAHRASLIEKFLRRVDYKLFHIVLLRKGLYRKLKSAKLSYKMADYHVTHGFDDDKVIKVLENNGFEIIKIDKYITTQTKLMHKIFQTFFTPSTWSLLARRKKL
jgi:2-polyprenyl-3-methyl-5-hydroxy-6-metoxy-1,4-benzoquinol methylase